MRRDRSGPQAVMAWSPAGWHPALPWAIVFLLWSVLFWPILPGLWDTWMVDADNSHGVLVPGIAAVLVWQRRHEIPWSAATPSLWGLATLAGSLVVYLMSLRAHLAFPAHLAMVGSLAGVVWWHLGTRLLRQLLFPIAFLLFMIPVPVSVAGVVTLPLQLFATSAAAVVIRAIGIPVLQEGTMLYFASASLEVTEACSGIRSMLAYLTLGTLFTYVAGDGIARIGKAILLFSTIPLALLVNILRISGTGILATLFGEQIARGFLHEFSGLVVFAFGFALFWAQARLFRQWLPKTPSVRDRVGGP